MHSNHTTHKHTTRLYVPLHETRTLHHLHNQQEMPPECRNPIFAAEIHSKPFFKKVNSKKNKLHHENAACEHAKCASGLECCARHARCRVKMVQKRRRSAKLMSKQVVANMLSFCSAKRPAADTDTSAKIRSCWRRSRRWAETSIPHAVFGQLVLVESGQPIGSKVMLQCFHLLTVHF